MLWRNSSCRYAAIKGNISEGGLLQRFESDNFECIQERRHRTTFRLAVAILLCNVVLLAFVIYHASKLDALDGIHGVSELNAQLKATSAFSPVLDAIDLSLRPRIMHGAFHDNSSIYRMPPSPKVDEAWDKLSMEGLEIITVSSSDIVRSGKDPALSVKAPLEWGQGDDAYIAQIEVFHLIHCLNELRKEIWSEYYYTYPLDKLRREHKAHCMHMILQNLMCTADVGIIQHNWVHNERIPEPKTRPFPDFNLNKMCRRFDELLEWAAQESVPDWQDKWKRLRIPDGAQIVPGDGYA